MDKTKSSVKILSECKREIELEIPSNEVMEEFERTVSKFSNRVKIRGFRPGKAPADIVKRMYSAEIRESIINSLAPEAIKNEMKINNFNPVGIPVVSDISFNEGGPIRLKAQFEVWPEFNLPEYKNIEVKKKSVSVTDQEINQSLQNLSTRYVQYLPVEGRGVLDGDYVVAELKGRNVKTKRFLSTEKVTILAGHPENEKVLNQNLTGLKPNEEGNFTISYDKSHKNKKLSGKEISYSLRVISIKERKIPDIDDEFAKEVGEFENLKELRKEIRKELLSAKERAMKQELAQEIIERISDKLSFELPDSVIEQESLNIVRQMLSSRSQKTSKEEFEKLKDEAKKNAEKNLKNQLILARIAEKENLEVSDAEVSEELKSIAKANNVPLAQIIDKVNKEGNREELKEKLLFKKTFDFLVEHAIIKG